MKRGIAEGFVGLRLALVLWSLSPVFVVWAIRGDDLLPGTLRISVAAATCVIPAIWLCYRLHQAKQTGLSGSVDELIVRRLTDRREHLLSYLFPILLSLWAASFDTWREFAAFVTVLFLSGIAFWHLQLTYVNCWFALVGLRAVEVSRETGTMPSIRPVILLTRNHDLAEGATIKAVKITPTLYFEA